MSSDKISSIQQRVLSSASNDEGYVNTALPKPVCWSEGMLLSPHHFQQNHQYWEKQLSRMVQSLAPDYWGIGNVVLDHSELAKGTVSIKRLFAVLPDGLMVDYDIKNDSPLKLDLEDIGSNPIAVQLTVPIQVAGSASSNAEIQRYISHEDKPTIDENTNDNEVVLSRLQAMMSLKLTDKVGDRDEGLPLFRVFKPEGGAIQLDPTYCPPLLSLSAANFLSGTEELPGPTPIHVRARNLAQQIRNKAMQLAGVSSSDETFGRHINSKHHLWIRAMVQGLVNFEVVANSPESSPRALYMELLRMASYISELSPNHIPPDFLAYCHDDNLPNFDKAFNYIKHYADSINLNYTTLNFEQVDSGIFALVLEKQWSGKDLIVELCPNDSCNSKNVTRWLKSSRIASANLHKDLSKRRLLGAKTEIIESDPATGVTPGTGNILCRIKANKQLMIIGERLLIATTSSKLKDYGPKAILVHIPHG